MENIEVENKESSELGFCSQEKTKQWLEGILQTYYTYIKKKECSIDSKDEKEISVKIEVIDFDIGPGYDGDGTLSTLSDLLSITVNYKMDEGNSELIEHLIVKIPPNDVSDREMAQLAQVDKREIHFYTEALVELQEFIKERKADINLSTPKCYFAKYHKQKIDPAHEVDETDSVTFQEAESVLVLEDIRPKGYKMKDCNIGLTLDETKAALKEIAVFHAVSWSYQQVKGILLDEKWDFSYRPIKAATTYKALVEQGFPTLAGFLEKQEPDGADLLQRLKLLHPKATDKLVELLEPPTFPNPSTLTHMDFWCNNLLFNSSNTNESCTLENQQTGNGYKNTSDENSTKCVILDWQMMTISRPTHDVALLLFTSLTPQLRNEHTTSLLQFYWEIFQETAGKLHVEIPFNFTTIESEFQKSQLLALLLVIGSIDLALDSEETELRLINALRDIAKQGLI